MTRAASVVPADRLLDDDVVSQTVAAWGRRLGSPPPYVAGELVRALLLCLAADAPPSVGLREAAAGLGVLRARQGHGAAALVEDVLALRPVVGQRAGEGPGLSAALEEALRAAVGAHEGEVVAAAAPGALTRDRLLGVLSRPVLEEALTHQVDAASRYGAPSLVVVDLDGLQAFREHQGQLACDLYLVRVTEILTASSRRSDLMGRLAPDQLAVVLPRTEQNRALVVARRVLARSLADARAGERADPGSTRHLPRLSVAVSWLAEPRTAAELFEAADQALERARRSGGGVVETNRPGPARAAAGAR